MDPIFSLRNKFLAKCNREYFTKFEIEKQLLAVVIFSKDNIVCSNLSDIVSYCKQYEIRYFTTMDILFSYEISEMKQTAAMILNTWAKRGFCAAE